MITVFIINNLKTGSSNIKSDGNINCKYLSSSVNVNAHNINKSLKENSNNIKYIKNNYVKYGQDFKLATNSAGVKSGRHWIIHADGKHDNVRKENTGRHWSSQCNCANQGFVIYKC